MKYTAILLVVLSMLFTACTDKKETAIELVKEGKKELHRGQIVKANNLFLEATELDETNFEAWYYLGNVKSTQKDYEGAIKLYAKAIEIKPDYAEAYANTGQAYFYMNNMQEACINFVKAEDLGMPNMRDKTKRCR